MKLTRLCISYASVHLTCAQDNTAVTDSLNNLIAPSNPEDFPRWYNGGPGIIVRAPDFITGDETTVVPASFWSNDIAAPSQFYPSAGNVWFPNSGWDGWGDISYQNPDLPGGENGPWSFASVGVVVGTEMGKLYSQFESVQESWWGNGVFYATDSNSVDKRCAWQEDIRSYNCPGGWLSEDGSFDSDTPGANGAGFVPPGPNGGGAGCHFDDTRRIIDQPDSSEPNPNLVSSLNCECNYDLGRDSEWQGWFDAFVNTLQQKDEYQDSRPWLGGNDRAPSWAMDATICWVNNPRDLIMMQNQLFWGRQTWNNGQVPLADLSTGDSAEIRKYWGWNEIPVDRNVVEDSANWDTVMIKLPADVDAVANLGIPELLNLESQLTQFVTQGKLMTGRDLMGVRPGSYVVFVKEMADENGNWQRTFYCESWTTPNNMYRIVFSPRDDQSDGACYIEAAPYNPQAIVHTLSQKCVDVQDGSIAPGQALNVQTCDGRESQGWRFHTDSTLTHATNDMMCVDVGEGQDGNVLQLWDCNGSPQQQIRYGDDTADIFTVSDAPLCVSAQNDGGNDGDALQLSQCGDVTDVNLNQLFDVTRAGTTPPPVIVA